MSDSLPAPGAILLAGGRASRVDGASKPLFDVGGRTLLAHAIDAVAAIGCSSVVVVGPEMALDPVGIDVRWVREDPPFAGPAAALVAGIRSFADMPPWTYVLACDLPAAVPAVAQLARDLPLLPADTEGICLADAGGRPQWLIGAYRTTALLRAARALPDEGRDASMRDLLADLAISAVRAPEALTDDVDTWEDLERARRRVGGPGGDDHRG